MTCIVGIVDRKAKTVVIGGDSAGVNESNITVRKDQKVFKCGEFVIGCTSSFRMIQLLRFSFVPPPIKSKNIYRYMCTDFIGAARACFKDGGYIQKSTEGDERGGTFLVGYKHRLFRVDVDFQVAENRNGIDAIGCGADFAIGALWTMKNESMTPKEKVIRSLDAASFFSSGVCKPFLVMSSN